MSDIERRFEGRRDAECAGKFRHRTQREAELEAEMLAGELGLAFDAYRCSWCRSWHVGRSRDQPR